MLPLIVRSDVSPYNIGFPPLASPVRSGCRESTHHAGGGGREGGRRSHTHARRGRGGRSRAGSAPLFILPIDAKGKSRSDSIPSPPPHPCPSGPDRHDALELRRLFLQSSPEAPLTNLDVAPCCLFSRPKHAKLPSEQWAKNTTFCQI